MTKNKTTLEYFEELIKSWEARLKELQSYKEPEPYYRSEAEVLEEIIAQVSYGLKDLR